MKVGEIMNKVAKYLKANNNYIMTKDLIKLGIDKHNITKLIEEGIIKKVCHGIYMDPKVMEDNYFILQLRYPNTIFSYNTAFHIMNMTDQIPSKLDITTYSGKQVAGEYNVHFVNNEKYNLGLTIVKSPFGNPIKVYNAERSICDMLKSKNFDLDIQNKILSNYFNSENKNIKLLEEYAKILNVSDKVNIIIEVMMKW